ncbi:MAG TPA: alpha/beta hydrolase [Bacteroidetes bacterium]|nr:alpha/beta hydrolase [Bacteroidota bacterium]
MLRLAPLALAVLLTGCQPFQRVALSFVYEPAELPDANVTDGLPYVDGSGNPKHRFTFFAPLADSVREAEWPTVVFVHGGGWTEGDRAQTFGGEDIYGNIGRFFAARGIGAATVSYRLQPEATWREQVHDVARAVEAVRQRAEAEGGNPEALVLMGHSAGAHLVTRVAVDEEEQARAGLPEAAVCGVMPISGAAFDLTDRRAFEIGENYDYYGARFGPPGEYPELPPEGPPAEWQTEASIVPFLDADEPPFLVVYAEGDYPALIRQAEVLLGALAERGIAHEEVIVPGSSHSRIVAALSRDDYVAGPAMLRFVRGLDCE